MTIYKEKSVFQVIAERWEAHGVGALLRIIEDRKRKLKSEGLFDRKRPIPEKIRKVGLITAPNGAAIRDIEVCLRDRLPIDSITLYPSLVQGQNADSSIMMGIRYFNGSEPTDVIVITRGGGSVEDLMCFNSEPLAREIFGSRIPVITAIGHEIDWTLADYVSDLRLPTPTAVASFMSPLKKEVSLRVDLIFRKIIKSITSLFERFLPRINSIFQGIRCTLGRNFNDRLSLLDNLEQRLSAFNREKILRQGYGIVRKAGKVVTRSTALVSGDLLEIEILGKKFTASVL
jgi:exodeoxyribonuclease VII large subunit